MKTLSIKDYDLEIKLPSIVNIIGLPGMGKTHLLKILINKIENHSIYLDDKSIHNIDIDFKKRNIAACLDLKLNTKIVEDELLYYLKTFSFSNQEQHSRLEEFTTYFTLEEFIKEKIENITIHQRALIKILSFLIINPLILGIDNLLAHLDEGCKKKIFSYAKQNNITILNITAEKEEFLLASHLMIIEKAKVKKIGTAKAVLADEKALAVAGFQLPFVVNISNGLNLYEMIDKKYYTLKSLVGAIWK